MATPTERLTAIANQLLERYGVLTRAAMSRETVPGGFTTLYPVLKAMEEAGRVRRGYFVEGLGGAQFAAPGAEDRLRAFRERRDEPAEVTVLAATDPANAYGAAIGWPEQDKSLMRPQRAAGAHLILRDGILVGFLGRSGHHLRVFLSDAEPDRGQQIEAIVSGLVKLAKQRGSVQIREIDGEPVDRSSLVEKLRGVGFNPTRHGYLLRGADA